MFSLAKVIERNVRETFARLARREPLSCHPVLWYNEGRDSG